MLLRLLKYLRGYVKIKVQGYSPERFLNLCNVNKILLWNLEHEGNDYEMCLSIKDYKKLRPLVRKTRTKIILLEKHGLPFFLFRFRKRKIFFYGMFFCIICVYSLSLFVWNIHFDGNRTQTAEELLAALEQMDVQHGTSKSRIVCEEIETMLRKEYPNMLWVSAELRGTKLIIQIKENEDKDIISKIEEKEEQAESIICKTTGIVESMVVRQGTPMVKAGDEVAAGDLLVEGFYRIKNDAGEIVRFEGVTADADIYVLKEEKYKDNFSVFYEKKNYTERKRLGVKLKIFDKIFQMEPKIRFENWDEIKKERQIHITENFYLPISVEYTWYLEYSAEDAVYTEEEMKQLAKKRFSEKYENILQKGVQIIEKDVRIEVNGKLCHVAGSVQLLVPETTKIPAVLPENATKASLEGE